jgi:UDP-N-acetylglucosamine--N-acetylmuramyl-(pentapeptide) pyrophosphoryl-undecaprenol N-acetylglucosamine transferase
VAAGGGLLVDDASLTPNWVGQHVVPLLADRTRLAAMADAAEAQGMPHADDRLAVLDDGAAEGRRAVVPAPPAGSGR